MKLPLPEDILPHRAPMLLLDEVIEVTPERAVATRIFNSDEEFFKSHFPGDPIVPGVYLVEAMAQLMAYTQLYQYGPHKMLLAGIKSAKFRKPVLPDEKVTFVLDVLGKKMGIYKAQCEAWVDEKKVAEAELSGSLQPIDQD